MHLLHRDAAKQHELAARAHRTAAEHNEREDNPTDTWYTTRAWDYSEQAFELAREAHYESGQIGAL